MQTKQLLTDESTATPRCLHAVDLKDPMAVIGTISRHVDECVLLRYLSCLKKGGFHTGCPTTVRCGSWPFKPPN
jgi:hypothetical protein